MQHFGLAPAVVLHRLFVMASGLVRRIHRTSVSQERQAAGGTPVNRDVQGTADAIYDVVDQFLRYRIGAMAPRLGPATWWIAARRAVEVSK